MTLRQSLTRLYALLPRSHRSRVPALLGLMLLNACSEIGGVAGLMPFVAVASNPQRIHTNPWLEALYTGLDIQSDRQFLVLTGLVFVAFLVTMNLINSLTFYTSCRFSFSAGSKLSQELLRSYLSRPFSWFLGRNTSDLVNSVLTEIDTVVERVILAAAELITMSLVASFMTIGLIALNPKVAFTSTALLLLLYSQVYLFSRRRAQLAGKQRLKTNEQRQRKVRDALNALKEARAFPKAQPLLDEFGKSADRYGRLAVRERLMAEVPKYGTETLAVTVIGGVLIYLVLQEGADRAIPMAGVYIMAIWRLVPALQTLYRNSVRIKFFSPVLEFLERELSQPRPDTLLPRQRLSMRQQLRLESVSYSYPGGERPAVHEISLTIPRGAVVALVGRTGSGKSTLADILAGLLPPDQGQLCIDGQALSPEDRLDWLSNLGYVPQDIYLLDDTLARNVALGEPHERIDRERVKQVVSAANLEGVVELEQVLGERGITLSGGQRQRVGIARALYQDPEFLIFDEATSALDNLTERDVMEAISALGGTRTVVLIAHRLSTVERCDCVFLLDEGRLVAQGTYQELLEHSPTFREMVGD